MRTNALRNKNKKTILNSVQKILINNLQKKYYLREKHQKLLNNILNTTNQSVLQNIISPITYDNTNIFNELQLDKVQILSKRKTIKTIDINCVIQRETTIEYCINEFLYLLFSK